MPAARPLNCGDVWKLIPSIEYVNEPVPPLEKARITPSFAPLAET